MAMKSLSTSRGNPYITIIWLVILGSALLFLFLLFTFFFRTQSSDWISVELPIPFFYSSIVIAFSSISLNSAKRCFKVEAFNGFFSWIFVTFCLAISFCLLQLAGWNQMVKNGINFKNISGAFIYILTGLHLLHLVLGLAGLGWLLFASYRNRRYVDGFILSLNPAKRSLLQMVTIFWHFLGALWWVVFLVLLAK